MENWLNIGVKGHADWSEKEMQIVFGGHALLLRPATRATEQSVHIKLLGIREPEAMTLINRFLSVLSWCDDASMQNIGGFSGSLKPQSISRETRHVGSSIAFPFGRHLEKDKHVRVALACYREARTVNSRPFSFLSYFRILNIVWDDKIDRNTRKRPLEEGITQTLPKITCELALARPAELRRQGKEAAKYLYSARRCAIAHAYKENERVDSDDIEELRGLSQDIHIVKALAEYLIRNQLKASRSIMG